MVDAVDNAEKLEQQAAAEREKARLESEKQEKIQALHKAHQEAKDTVKDLCAAFDKGKDCSEDVLKYLLEQFELCEKKLQHKLAQLLAHRSYLIQNLREGTLDMLVNSKLSELDTVKKFIKRLEELLHAK